MHTHTRFTCFPLCVHLRQINAGTSCAVDIWSKNRVIDVYLQAIHVDCKYTMLQCRHPISLLCCNNAYRHALCYFDCLLETLVYAMVDFDLLPLCSHPSHFIDPFPRPGQLIYMRAVTASTYIGGALLRSQEGALMHCPKQHSGSLVSCLHVYYAVTLGAIAMKLIAIYVNPLIQSHLRESLEGLRTVRRAEMPRLPLQHEATSLISFHHIE